MSFRFGPSKGDLNRRIGIIVTSALFILISVIFLVYMDEDGLGDGWGFFMFFIFLGASLLTLVLSIIDFNKYNKNKDYVETNYKDINIKKRKTIKLWCMITSIFVFLLAFLLIFLSGDYNKLEILKFILWLFMFCINIGTLVLAIFSKGYDY